MRVIDPKPRELELTDAEVREAIWLYVSKHTPHTPITGTKVTLTCDEESHYEATAYIQIL